MVLPQFLGKGYMGMIAVLSLRRMNNTKYKQAAYLEHVLSSFEIRKRNVDTLVKTPSNSLCFTTIHNHIKTVVMNTRNSSGV